MGIQDTSCLRDGRAARSLQSLLGRFAGAIARSAGRFLRDTEGVILPYVAVLLVVIVGVAVLGLDGARYESLQTQLQKGADALALAGAAELNGRSDSITRATAAIDGTGSAVLVTNSSFFGGSNVAVSSTCFLSSLPAGTVTSLGTCLTTSASDQQRAKYVQVVVQPVTIGTILPASFFGGANSATTQAQAVAGYTGITVCSVAPIFICNPYEAVGNTDDAAAKSTLLTKLSDPATLRKQLRISLSSGVSPGNFGWVVTADCTNGSTSCLRADVLSATGACYNSYSIALNTGNTNNVLQFFDTRFDIYNQSPAPSPSQSPPSVNVRKGYLPGKNGNTANWCAGGGNGAAPPNTTSTYYTYPATVVTTGNITSSGNQTAKKTILNVLNTTNVGAGETISSSNTGFPTSHTPVSSVSGTSVIMDNPATQTANAISLTFNWNTSGLPEDKSFSGFQGNGDWDCANYWAINHTASAPAGCTTSNPTISRYQVYRYEIANSLVNDWSGNNGWSSNRQADTGSNPLGNFETESGHPYCAAASGVSGVDTTTGGLDRRDIIVPIINCEAQTALGNITNGAQSTNVPVAAFGKFFLTQPWAALGGNSLYGELTGTVGSGDNITIYNLVELYR
jgi:hypothetical protein